MESATSDGDQPSDRAPESQSAARAPLALVLLAAALALVPFALGRFVPSADLPQHLAQVRLWQEQLGWLPETTPKADYETHATAPNNLVYLPLLLLARVAPPVLAGKLMVMLLALAWIATVHFVARRRGRPVEAALLAGLFVFNASLYWGFLNFLAGAPLFLLLLHLSSPAAPDRGRPVLLAVQRALCTLALLYAHSLWFALGAALVVVEGLRRREGWRSLAWRGLALLPAVAIGAAWYPSLVAARRAGGFDVAARWFGSLLDRLAPGRFVDAAFGGLKGALEPLVLVLVGCYLAAALITHRARIRRGLDGALLTAGLVCLGLYLFAPDKYANTIQFNARFAPYAVALLVLALPRPVLRPAFLRTAVLVVAVAFYAWTSLAWHAFERAELSGLALSLDSVRTPTRVLGLDLQGASDIVKGRPFLQTFAWFQARDGGTGNFSFAEHASGVVRYRAPRRTGWTAGLDWYPARVTPNDLKQFDYLLLDGPPEIHTRLARWAGATSLVDRGQFRLYRLPTRSR